MNRRRDKGCKRQPGRSMSAVALFLACHLLTGCSQLLWSDRKLHLSSLDVRSAKVVIASLDLSCLEFEPTETLLFQETVRRSVHGKIYSNDQPLKGVAVFLEPVGDPAEAFLEMSDEDGAFSFSGIPSGEYKLWTCMSGWSVVLMPIRILPEGDESNIRIDLPLSV